MRDRKPQNKAYAEAVGALAFLACIFIVVIKITAACFLHK